MEAEAINVASQSGEHFYLFSFLIIVSVMKINSYYDALGKNKSIKKWDFIETLFAIFFGWLGLLYIVFSHSNEIFNSNPGSSSTKSSKEEE